MLRIAIVEDEAEHAETLAEFSRRYAAGAGDTAAVTLFPNAIPFLEPYRAVYDVVFMDIRMPYMDGMEAAVRLRRLDDRVALVFITSMAQYAIRGYEVDALDFILKPVDYDTFCMKMQRIRRYCRRRGPAAVTLTDRDGARVLRVRDIHYIEVYSHSLIFHTEDGRHETHGQLSALEEDARFSGFVRCSPSHLVNCDYITGVGADSLTVAGESVPLSRRRRKACMEKMARIMGGGWL